MGCDAPGARRTLFRSDIPARMERGEPTAPYTKLGAFKLPNQNLRDIFIKRTQSEGSPPALAEDPRLINAPAGTARQLHIQVVYLRNAN